MSRVLVLVLPLFVGGCFLPVNFTMVSLVVNGLTMAATGKGTADHALSAIASQDCAMLRVVQSEAVCRASEAGSPVTDGEEVNKERLLRAGTMSYAATQRGQALYHPSSAAPTVLVESTPR